MIYCYFGENEYEAQHAVKRLTARFSEQYPEASVEHVEAGSLNPQELTSLCSGMSLFSTHKLVLIRDADKDKSTWELLPDCLENNDELTIVILQQQSVDKRTKTYKWLQKHADLKEFKELDEPRLISWIQTFGRDRGVNLEPEIARLILGRVGSDQWRLHNEIIKLTYVKTALSRELITDIIEPTLQASAFELLDATIAHKSQDIQQLLASVRLNEDPYRFIGLLTSQVYALTICHAAGDRPSAMIAKDAGIHPYVISKTQAIARRLSKENLCSIVESIAKLDEMLKSSGGDPWLLIEVSLNKIATRKGVAT